QAEDGIRDDLVTGVQTCALPICRVAADRVHPGTGGHEGGRRVDSERASATVLADRASDGGELDAEVAPLEGAARLFGPAEIVDRSEERRGGKGGRKR